MEHGYYRFDPATPIADQVERLPHLLPQEGQADDHGAWEISTSYHPGSSGQLAGGAAQEVAGDDEPEDTPAVRTAVRSRDLHPCLCSLFEVVDPDTGEVVGSTGCQKSTRSRFAPGHDAKLKSLLISAGVHGRRVRERNDRTETLRRPLTIANRFGFGEQVKRAISNRRRSWS